MMTAGEGNRLRAGLLAISIAKEAFAQASVTHTQPGYQDGSVKPPWPQGALLDLQMLVLGARSENPLFKARSRASLFLRPLDLPRKTERVSHSFVVFSPGRTIHTT